MHIKRNQSLKELVHFKIGGNAEYFVTVEKIEQAQEVRRLAQEKNWKVHLLGAGSNVLISDEGLKGLVVHFSPSFSSKKEKTLSDFILSTYAEEEAFLVADKLGSQDFQAYCKTLPLSSVLEQSPASSVLESTQDTAYCVWSVEAGKSLKELSSEATAQSLSGLEFACGIPGSVGGAIYMNAGAYAYEIKDTVIASDVLTSDGRIVRILGPQQGFSYRKSLYGLLNEEPTHEVSMSKTQQQERYMEGRGLSSIDHELGKQVWILRAHFLLKKAEASAIQATVKELTEKRESKQPLNYPSAGSIFKRPEGNFAGRLIDEAGLRGYRIGGAEISQKHTGFIVNVHEASAEDVLRLIDYVQDVVREKYSVCLEPEVRLWGFEHSKLVKKIQTKMR